MKQILFKTILLFIVLVAVSACKKEEKLNIDFSKYNMDDPGGDAILDQWLTNNFLNPYNIEVTYKYKRYLHEVDKDIAPVKVEKVQPQMQAMIDALIEPYKKVGGINFVKTVMPKQVVLYGSGSYNYDASINLGTLTAGTTLHMYMVNFFDTSDIEFTGNRIGTLQHEFTHAINNKVPIPGDFQYISRGNYDAAWNSYNDAQARALGFVSPYARSSPEEDYAETNSRLLRRGQWWFDNWANGSTPEGKIALKAKEAHIVKYYKDNFNIDYRALQSEVQRVLEYRYNYNWLKLREYGYTKLTVDLSNAVNATYPTPSQFATAYNNFKQAVAAYNNLNYRMVNLQFIFAPATSELTVRIPYTNAAGTLQYNADYKFSYAVGPAGGIVFTKATQGTGGNASNAALFTTAFQQTIQAYLTQETFVASWLSSEINGANTTTKTYGGFYNNSDRNDYFYGSLEK